MRKTNASRREWAGGTVLPAFAAAMCLALAGCAALGGDRDGWQGDSSSSREDAPRAEAPFAPGPPPAKRFEEPGELDKMLDAKPIALAAVTPAAAHTPGAAGAGAGPAEAGKGNFRLQIGAESDVDAAQAKKVELERLLGGNVDVVFDAPYYKLRWGYFDSKRDAEDKLLELSDHKIQGFVVKQ
jgi:cell division protein FtsN